MTSVEKLVFQKSISFIYSRTERERENLNEQARAVCGEGTGKVNGGGGGVGVAMGWVRGVICDASSEVTFRNEKRRYLFRRAPGF